MSEAVSSRISLDEFWPWQRRQDDRYELIDGAPVAMPTEQQHDRIVTNLLIAIGVHLQGGPCRVFTADQTVVTRSANGRRPDLGVDCGPLEPTVIFWSRSADRSWAQAILTGLDAVLPFATIGLDLPLAALYSGLDLRPRPRVVPPS